MERTQDHVLADAHELALQSARDDFNAFAEYVGVDQDGEPLVQHPLHRLMWDFVDWAHARELYAGIMCPSGHGKTTQIELRAAREIGKDPNILCRVVTSSEGGALERATAVRAFMARPEYRRVFPGVVIERGEQSETEFTVRRSGISKDPTLGCSGVTTGTGARVTCLILDDIVDTRNAILNPAERPKVYTALREIWMSRPVAIGLRKPMVVWIQTAYHVDDAAARTKLDPESGWAWLIVRAEEPYRCLTYEVLVRGEVVQRGTLPNVFPSDELRRRAGRMGKVAAARALGNREMVEGQQPFTPDLFEGPRPLHPSAYARKVARFDPAGDPKAAKKGDPDFAALAVVGKHPTEARWDVIYSDRIRAAPKRQAEWCAVRCAELGVTALHVEAIADGAMPVLVAEELKKIEYLLPVERDQPHTNKEIRIQEALEPRLRQGLLACHGRFFQELVAEALVFPLGGHDDLLDALAGAVEKSMSMGPARHRSSVKREEGDRPRMRPPRMWQRRGRVWAD